MTNTLIFAEQTITDEHIFGGVSYLADLNAGEEFTIGNTASASVSFVTDISLPLYTKDPDNGTFVWTQTVDGSIVDSLGDVILTDTGDSMTVEAGRGRFYITEVTKSGGMYTVTAYDGMILLETAITALGEISYPVTAAELASAIETYSGYPMTGTLNNGSLTCVELDDALTIRALLGYIAEISGANVKLTASGELRFMYYEDSGIELTASDYKAIEVADYECSEIDCVKIVSSAGEVVATAGTGDNTLFVAGNPFTDEAEAENAEAIFDMVGGFTYSPLTSELFNEEGLEIGVGATFGDNYTLIMRVEASTENGVTVASVGNDSREEFNKSLDLKVMEAMSYAKKANETAEEVNNYFWTTPTDTGFGSGAHITQKPRSQVLADPDNAGGNLLADSTGITARDGLTELATFGVNGARIGKSDEAHLELDYGSMQLVDKDGNPFFRVFDLNDAQGRYEKTEQYTGYHMQVVIDGVTYYAVGLDEYAESVISVTVDGVSKVSPTDYILYTQQSYGTSLICFTYNIGTTATIVVSYYVDSDALKAYTIGTRATGDVGLFSVAEGYEVVASGKHSHAQNIGTEASRFAQTAIGRYNDNQINTAFEIGNGSSESDRSNAFAVDWNGNAKLKGDVFVGCDADGSGGTKLKAISLRNLVVNHAYQATTTNWEYVGANFTVPSGHVYLVMLTAGWTTGKPLGIGVNGSSTLSTNFPPDYGFVENSNGANRTPLLFLSQGTYYMFCKRASVPTSSNNHSAYAIDIPT